MRTTISKRVPVIISVILVLVLVLSAGVTVFGGTAYAADDEIAQKINEISVGHLSDIHYFPLEYCYTKDVDSDEYKQTDFYHSMTGDTKLVLESGITLNSTIQQIIQDGKDKVAPQYLIASGDLSKNGERGALIDVANSLRYLQNSMRALGGDYKNFQVFAIVGNHDLYNHNGAFYSKEDGHSIEADMVTAAQFAMIFAGLGFPNASTNGNNGSFDLTTYMPESYWSSSYTDGYVYSENAANLEIEYYSPALQAINASNGQMTSEQKLAQYFAIGDELNQLTYFADVKDVDTDKSTGYSFAIIDSTDREATETGSPVRVSEEEYAALSEKPVLYLDNGAGVIDFSIEYNDDTAFTVAASENKNVYRRTPVQHITGGRIKEACIDWLEARTQTVRENAHYGEQTIISSFHHNVLPHFEQEDDILKDFTVYNWEYIAKRLLDMGIRYTLSGHMHASDIMTYTDIEGRTLYDFETGSIISYASPRRYITFTRMDCGGKLGEKVESLVHILDSIKEIASDHITIANAWNQTAYEDALKTGDWDNIVASNPDYLVYIIRYEEFAQLGDNNYNDFISKDIYTVLVDRMINHFITQSTVDGLLDSVFATLSTTLDNLPNTAYNALSLTPGTILGVAHYVIDTALFRLYGENGDYPYNGETYDTAVNYVRAIIFDFLNKEYGDENIASTNNINPNNKGKMNIKEIASFIMMSHSAGIEISLDEKDEDIDAKFTEVACGANEFRYKQPTDKTYRKRMVRAINDLHNQLISGQFVQDLLDALLNPLFNNDDALLKKLLNYEFDFSKAVDEGYLTSSEYSKWSYFLRKALGKPDGGAMGLIRAFLRTKLGVELPEDFALSYDPEKVSLGEIINDLLPIVKPLVGDLIGFNMDGDDLITIVDNALKGYITPSFLVGLGGIADEIIIAFGTDVYQDLQDPTNPSEPLVVQPTDGYYTYGEEKFAFISTKNKVSEINAEFNAATQANGRVPSRVTANFDTKDSTTSYTFKFYTAEEVYGTFRYKTTADGEWITLSTTAQNANGNTDYNDSVATAPANTDEVSVEMLTQTKPVYLPLIDLGLLCLTHAQIEYDTETEKDVPIKYGERDIAAKNSVVYWNVTTVTISGLKAGTTYYYDLAGNYDMDGTTNYFSFAEYNKKVLDYDKDYFTFTTAADDSVTAFEFLTIADIQGMIQSMYTDSYAAIKALLSDSRTKDFDFILNAGDMCDNGKNFNQWAQALDTYQQVFANTSMFFAAGNHESGSNAIANHFNYTLPTNAEGETIQKDVTDGMFYSFNYANAHFIVLNTNDADSNGLGADQLAWLENDLTGNTAKWTFVLMHKSVFSGGSHSTDSEVVAMRDQLVPLFANNGVNIVFGGHDHTFTSTMLIDKNGKAHDKIDLNGVQYTGDGVLYITLGTMGTKFYTYQDNPVTSSKFDKGNSILHTLDSQTFGKVVVDGDTITFASYYYNSETKQLEQIGGNVLSVNDVLDSRIVIALCVVIPVVVIGAIVTTLLILKKKGKLGAKK